MRISLSYGIVVAIVAAGGFAAGYVATNGSSRPSASVASLEHATTVGRVGRIPLLSVHVARWPAALAAVQTTASSPRHVTVRPTPTYVPPISRPTAPPPATQHQTTTIIIQGGSK